MIAWESPNAKFYLGGDGLQVYRSERFVVVTRANTDRSKILQVIFWKDGSIFVDFPFFAHTNGIVTLLTHPANVNAPVDVSLLDQGKVTSHLVKYSHRPDGNAHFSQTGKVLTQVRKKCLPIHEIEGHFFTVQVQGLNAYEQLDIGAEKTSSLKKAFIEAVFTGESPEAIKIVGRLYSRKTLRVRARSRIFGPLLPTRDPHGNLRQACILSAPIRSGGEDLNLLLTCQSVPRIDQTQESTLSFFGGFDHKSIIEDMTKPSTFLALVYPAENTEELSKQIGSIDFIDDSSKLSNSPDNLIL